MQEEETWLRWLCGYALMVLEMMNRKPIEILIAEYSFLAFDSEDGLDVSEREKSIRLAMDMLEPIASEQKF